MDYPGCCGPLGGGHVAYDLYVRTGPNLVFGNGPFTERLNTGWIIAGGGRSLFFNPTNDAAWVVDLGLSYQYNRGSQNDPADLVRFVRDVWPFVRECPDPARWATLFLVARRLRRGMGRPKPAGG